LVCCPSTREVVIIEVAGLIRSLGGREVGMVEGSGSVLTLKGEKC